MSNLQKRWLGAKDFLNNPSLLDSYPHKYVLLVDQSADMSYHNLLMAIEQMENRGWVLNSIASRDSAHSMYALMCRKQ